MTALQIDPEAKRKAILAELDYAKSCKSEWERIYSLNKPIDGGKFDLQQIEWWQDRITRLEQRLKGVK